jgi:hypothetical protein
MWHLGESNFDRESSHSINVDNTSKDTKAPNFSTFLDIIMLPYFKNIRSSLFKVLVSKTHLYSDSL